MYYELLYLIPLTMALFIAWFFYPTLAGTRETKISRKEYAWFGLCIVFIPLFGFDLFLASLYFASWYACPQEIDVWSLILIYTPWIVITGAGTAYGIRTIGRSRRKLRTPGKDDSENREET